MHKDSLKKYLPSFIGDTKVFSELFNVEGKELDAIYSKMADIEAQFNIDTATWALDIYEKELGITTDYTKIDKYRRSVIKSKLLGTGKLDENLIKIVCDSFGNGDVVVNFDGKIHIKFTSVRGIPPNMNDFKNAIEEIKPAYLELVYDYTYNTWGMVYHYKWAEVSNKTWSQLASI